MLVQAAKTWLNCNDKSHTFHQGKRAERARQKAGWYTVKSCEVDQTQHCKGPRLAFDEDRIVALGLFVERKRDRRDFQPSHMQHQRPVLISTFKVPPSCMKPAKQAT